MGVRTFALYTTATPTTAQLETEWRANWKDISLDVDQGTWLFVWVKADAYPATVRIYLRSGVGDELSGADPLTPVWGLHPDGAATVNTPDPSDGWALLRYFIGRDVSGVVVQAGGAGRCQISTSAR